jgi:hypothetical protein
MLHLGSAIYLQNLVLYAFCTSFFSSSQKTEKVIHACLKSTIGRLPCRIAGINSIIHVIVAFNCSKTCLRHCHVAK